MLLSSFEGGWGTGLREQLAAFTAALLAGFPVWLIPRLRIQRETAQPGLVGVHARQSLVRKLYVYFFLFIGTMTILSSAVYLVYGLLLRVLGEAPPTFIELAQAISYSLIAAGVLAYHSVALRGDGQASQQARVQKLEALRILVLDAENGKFGKAITEALNRENPGLNLAPLTLPSPADEETAPDRVPLVEQVRQAGLIVALTWSRERERNPGWFGRVGRAYLFSVGLHTLWNGGYTAFLYFIGLDHLAGAGPSFSIYGEYIEISLIIILVAMTLLNWAILIRYLNTLQTGENAEPLPAQISPRALAGWAFASILVLVPLGVALGQAWPHIFS